MVITVKGYFITTLLKMVLRMRCTGAPFKLQLITIGDLNPHRAF